MIVGKLIKKVFFYHIKRFEFFLDLLSLPKIQSKFVSLSSFPAVCSECSQVLGSARQQRRHLRDLRYFFNIAFFN